MVNIGYLIKKLSRTLQERRIGERERERESELCLFLDLREIANANKCQRKHSTPVALFRFQVDLLSI